MARRRRPSGECLIDNAKKIDAAIADAKHLLEEQLDSRRLQGKDLRRLVLRMIILHAFDDPKKPTSIWTLQPRPLSLSMFGGTAARPMVYDEKAETIIEEAQRHADVDAAVCEVAADFIERGLTMHPVLRSYIVERLRSLPASAQSLRRARNQKVYTNFRRNFAIVTVVAKLVDRGFHATRNEGTDRECACSIVVAALERLGIDLTYHAVAKIWADRGELTEPFTAAGPATGGRRKGKNRVGQQMIKIS